MFRKVLYGNNPLQTRLIKGVGAQGFGLVVQMFVRFAEVPLLLGFWGKQQYGEWLMLAAIPAYLIVGDGGFTTAATREMSMRSAAGDRRGALAVFQSIWTLLLIISICLISIVFFVIPYLPINEWFGFEQTSLKATGMVINIFVLHVLMGFQLGLLNGSFWCTGHYPLGMFLTNVTQLLEFGSFAIVVVLGGGLAEAAMALLVGRSMGLILLRFGLNKTGSWLRYGFEEASLGEVKRLITPAIATLAFPLGNALNIQGIRLVIGIVLGPAALAIFSPIRTLSRLAFQPRSIINRLIQPEMSLAFGRGDRALFRRLFSNACQLSLWITLATSLVLGITGGYLLYIWTNSQITMNWIVYILLLLAAVVNSVWFIALTVMYATNRHERAAVVYSIVYGVVATTLVYGGASTVGYSGVAFVLLFSEIMMTAYVVPQALHYTDQYWQKWIRTVFSPPLSLFQKSLSTIKRG